MTTLNISGKVIGKSQPVFADWKLSIPEGETSLEDLLVQIVRSEVEEFQERQNQRRLTKILSAKEIELDATRGKIESGGSDLQQDVNIEEVIDTAIQAFKDGLYLVFIDDEQKEDLQASVRIRSNSELLFLRLIPLVGG
jgi:hypothetical protein